VKFKGRFLTSLGQECPGCRGLFLRRRVLRKVTGVPDIERLLHDYAGEKSPIKCPRCNSTMKLRTLRAQGHAVTVDLCIDCRGIWLDEGELEELQAAYGALQYEVKTSRLAIDNRSWVDISSTAASTGPWFFEKKKQPSEPPRK
jgi:Zn-finger nucleic acid-binding protein